MNGPLACQFDHQEIFHLLVQIYGADPNVRDNAGKKPIDMIMD